MFTFLKLQEPPKITQNHQAVLKTTKKVLKKTQRPKTNHLKKIPTKYHKPHFSNYLLWRPPYICWD